MCLHSFVFSHFTHNVLLKKFVSEPEYYINVYTYQRLCAFFGIGIGIGNDGIGGENGSFSTFVAGATGSFSTFVAGATGSFSTFVAGATDSLVVAAVEFRNICPSIPA